MGGGGGERDRLHVCTTLKKRAYASELTNDFSLPVALSNFRHPNLRLLYLCLNLRGGGGMFGGGCEFMTSNVRSVMKTSRDGPFNVETDQQTLATERKIIHCSANPPTSQNWLVLPLRLV